MPGKRRAGSKRYRKKGDKTMPRTKKDWNQDKRIVRLEKSVASINRNTELKYVEASWSATATATGATVLCNGLAPGTNQISRIGAQIHMTSIMFNFYATNLTSTLTPTVFRFMLILDRQPNGAAPDLSGDPVSGLEVSLLNNALLPLTQAFRQYETVHRYKILEDKIVVFNPQMSLQDANPATAVVAITKEMRGYHKLNHYVKYGDDTAGIASINTNSIYAVFFANVTNGVTIVGGSRIYFKDS